MPSFNCLIVSPGSDSFPSDFNGDGQREVHSRATVCIIAICDSRGGERYVLLRAQNMLRSEQDLHKAVLVPEAVLRSPVLRTS